ncbi:MAG: hypothetical protein CFE46_10230 [Burkholderiales bacterium PBB6]|nr:MAG: hypothetical protein CFE46_10230 [Burkholderiales bacterium PBB6]
MTLLSPHALFVALLSWVWAAPTFAQSPVPTSAPTPAPVNTQPAPATAPQAISGPSHPWVVAAPRLRKEAYFSNLADGDTIDTPYLVKFGLTGMGLAPIVAPVAGTGHHHLLINRDLPLDFNKPLPFNDQYIHFGKGQMETVLNLAPGAYQLRLVLADEKHIPNFVFSKPLHVIVKRKRPGVDPKSLVVPGVAVLAPGAGETVKPPFRVALHASGLNVSSTALKEKGTGHFRVKLKPEGAPEVVLPLTNGFTELWLSPPPGAYTVSVEFIDNTQAERVLATGPATAFRVER